MGKVAPVEREIVHLFRFDNVAEIGTWRLQLGSGASHRHYVDLSTDGHNKINRRGLSDCKCELRNPLLRETLSGRGNQISTRGDIEEEIGPRTIGCGCMLDRSSHIFQYDFAIWNYRAAGISHGSAQRGRRELRKPSTWWQ